MTTLTPQTTSDVWVVRAFNSGGSTDEFQVVQTSADAALVTVTQVTEAIRTLFTGAGGTSVSVNHYTITDTVVPAP